MTTPYRIFKSPEGDWYIAAVKACGPIEVLYENHDKAQAYEAILKDLGIVIPVLERKLVNDTYFPKPKDWKE